MTTSTIPSSTHSDSTTKHNISIPNLIALVDCNSFYCSCERVFRPDLENRPVIVLSNNDGCAVARSDEAKKIGIEMGAPYFKIKDLCKKNNVAVFSSNYTLYGDMSRRVMSVLSEFTPDMEVYSIDEAFLSLTGFSTEKIHSYAKEIQRRVKQETGIPVSIGIGPTKVLAKLANRKSKKNKQLTQGILALLNDQDIQAARDNFPVEDLWGIGRQSQKKLLQYKIKTAEDLVKASPEMIQKLLTIQGARIQQELKGIPCIEFEFDSEDKKQIISSRSFGHPLTAVNDLKEAIANHITTAAEKLRKQNSYTKHITVFIQTNPFKNTPQYYNSGSLSLLSGTADTAKLIKHSFRLLDSIYKTGFEYKKCGVIFSDIHSKNQVQLDFFNLTDSPKDELRMNVIDAINEFHGRGTLKYAACGVNQFWKMLSEMKSHCYTTRWSELLKVK